MKGEVTIRSRAIPTKIKKEALFFKASKVIVSIRFHDMIINSPYSRFLPYLFIF